MDIRRVVLYGALALVGYFLWMNWQADYPAAPVSTTVTQTIAQPATTESRLLPAMNTTSNSDTIPVAPVTQNVGQRVYVKTDVLSVAIDLKHGDIVNAQLLAYPETAGPQSKPFTLLQDNPTLQYVAESMGRKHQGSGSIFKMELLGGRQGTIPGWRR